MNELDELQERIARAKGLEVEWRWCDFSPDCCQPDEIQSMYERHSSDTAEDWAVAEESGFNAEGLQGRIELGAFQKLCIKHGEGNYRVAPDWPRDMNAAMGLLAEMREDKAIERQELTILLLENGEWVTDAASMGDYNDLSEGWKVYHYGETGTDIPSEYRIQVAICRAWEEQNAAK